jgi:hypothetical protein
VDRKNASVYNVTVDNVTIAFTEYRLKPKKERKEKAAEGNNSNNNSSSSKAEAASNHSDAESDSMEPSGQDRSS